MTKANYGCVGFFFVCGFRTSGLLPLSTLSLFIPSTKSVERRTEASVETGKERKGKEDSERRGVLRRIIDQRVTFWHFIVHLPHTASIHAARDQESLCISPFARTFETVPNFCHARFQASMLDREVKITPEHRTINYLKYLFTFCQIGVMKDHASLATYTPCLHCTHSDRPDDSDTEGKVRHGVKLAKQRFKNWDIRLIMSSRSFRNCPSPPFNIRTIVQRREGDSNSSPKKKKTTVLPKYFEASWQRHRCS